MTIELQNIGKKFNKDWIFRNFNYEFKSGNSYAVTGHNGSGKSTLLDLIMGLLEPTDGEIIVDNFSIKMAKSVNNAQKIVLISPYLRQLQYHRVCKSRSLSCNIVLLERR
jgi:ABC-type multidrug transport system ATPase subunit